jgi:hypothetical protein
MTAIYDDLRHQIKRQKANERYKKRSGKKGPKNGKIYPTSGGDIIRTRWLQLCAAILETKVEELTI